MSEKIGVILEGNARKGIVRGEILGRDGDEKAAVDVHAVARELAHAVEEGIPMLGKKLRGFDAPDAVLTAVETRSSSPVRIVRESESYQFALRGLYPCGEGAGYAGGIMSAAADGLRVAEMILEELNHE